MCYLLLQYDPDGPWPVRLLANRDEDYDRAFDPPALLDETHGIFAPRDQRAGGTWIGLNRSGVVAAITNALPQHPREDFRSRGLLVLDSLAHEAAGEAVHWLANHLLFTRYDSFNLLIADRGRATLFQYKSSPEAGGWPEQDAFELEPGTYAISNLHDFGALEPHREGGLITDEPIDMTFARFGRIAADETTELPGGHRILKRGEGRGTVSSSLIALPQAPGAPARMAFLAGRPGEVEYTEQPVPGRS